MATAKKKGESMYVSCLAHVVSGMVYRAVAKTTPTQPIHIEWEGGGLFRQIFFVLVVHIWVLGDPNFPAKKRKRNQLWTLNMT